MTVDPASLIYASFEAVALEEYVNINKVPSPSEVGLIKKMAVKAIGLAPLLASMTREEQEAQVRHQHDLRKAAMQGGA